RHATQDRLALSPREKEVLRLLHDGLSVPAIAAQMFISVSTAKTYVARLYEKLGAANRAQALMAALHHGLIQYHEDTSSEGKGTPHGGRRPGADRRQDIARSLALVEPDPQDEGDVGGEPGSRAREPGRLVSSARGAR
ncbi:MAG TPA: response regulator transcription factor, partial [Streptosporangiaceae bacterium]|nr:response regulator transcription factor [Streptosporangiaceae bacterium]